MHRPYLSDASYPLKEWDVITQHRRHAGRQPGHGQTGRNLRVRFQYRVQQLAKNGKVPLTIVRGGKPMQVQLPVAGARQLLIPDLNGDYPPYFIYGPIVFSRASPEFMSSASPTTPR